MGRVQVAMTLKIGVQVDASDKAMEEPRAGETIGCGKVYGGAIGNEKSPRRNILAMEKSKEVNMDVEKERNKNTGRRGGRERKFERRFGQR